MVRRRSARRSERNGGRAVILIWRALVNDPFEVITFAASSTRVRARVVARNAPCTRCPFHTPPRPPPSLLARPRPVGVVAPLPAVSTALQHYSGVAPKASRSFRFPLLSLSLSPSAPSLSRCISLPLSPFLRFCRRASQEGTHVTQRSLKRMPGQSARAAHT